MRFKTHQHDNGYGAYWPPSGHGVGLKDENPSSSQCGMSGIRTRTGNSTDYLQSALTTAPQSAPVPTDYDYEVTIISAFVHVAQ